MVRIKIEGTMKFFFSFVMFNGKSVSYSVNREHYSNTIKDN